MARPLSDDVASLVRDLVRKLTNFAEDSEPFAHCERHVATRLARADTMSFVDAKEIDTAISGLAEKYAVHGFGPQADELRGRHARFAPKGLARPQLDDRLNVLKFLLCLSESPTKYFLEHPELAVAVEPEERIDWCAYLKEGIEQWSPTYTSSSDEWTDNSGKDTADNVEVGTPTESPAAAPHVEPPAELHHVDCEELRRNISGSVQSGWFRDGNAVQEVPESTNVDARISFHWDEYVRHASHGLLDQRTNVVTEYKAMRETVWQFWGPHASACFAFDGDVLSPKGDVSISSVRPMAFRAFMNEFLPYVAVLQSFRDFRKSLWDESETLNPPGTYFCYNETLEQITKPFFVKLTQLEDKIKEQKTIMTLLKMASALRKIFETVAIVKRIHDRVVLDFRSNSPVHCATTLLSRLRDGLLNSATSKKEFDVYLTLYVGSLFRYFQIINWWFNNDSLVDSFNEFIVVNGSCAESDSAVLKSKFSLRNFSAAQTSYESICFSDTVSIDSEPDSNENHARFSVRHLDGLGAQDNVLRTIATDVLQIGKNIRHLHMLHKLHLLDTKSTSRLYDDYVDRLLRKISNYFKSEPDESERYRHGLADGQLSYKFPAMCPDYVKYPTDMDKLENLVDTSDGFLMEAFKTFFTEKPRSESQRTKEKTLYERVSETTKTLFPIEQILDVTFAEVFEERYSNSGYTVIDLLLNEHRITEHFELLGYLYLFRDDLLSPWYRKLFRQMGNGEPLDSDIWQTVQLHDILMDMFPSLYERCMVKVGDMWNLYRDPLKACSLVGIEYLVDWPISMIIRKDHIEMYKHVFQFVLQIKWALYTLNHTYFSEIEDKVQIPKQHKAVTILLRRLKVYRFWLINEFSTIQHYVLGNLCANASAKFRAALKNACNLDTLFSSHHDFVGDLHSSFIGFRDYNHNSYGFNYLLYLVTKLRLMWSDLESIDDRELVKFEKAYKICHGSLDTLIFPENVNRMY